MAGKGDPQPRHGDALLVSAPSLRGGANDERWQLHRSAFLSCAAPASDTGINSPRPLQRCASTAAYATSLSSHFHPSVRVCSDFDPIAAKACSGNRVGVVPHSGADDGIPDLVDVDTVPVLKFHFPEVER